MHWRPEKILVKSLLARNHHRRGGCQTLGRARADAMGLGKAITRVMSFARAQADALILGEAITATLIGPAFRTSWAQPPYSIGTGAIICH